MAMLRRAKESEHLNGSRKTFDMGDPRRKFRLWRDARILRDSGLFDTRYYLETYPDVARAQFDPIIHYLTHGASERRNPSPYFETSYYLQRNPDVALAGVNPLLHYVTDGAGEGRDPNPLFDTSFYLLRNPGVAETGINPLAHYATQCTLQSAGPDRVIAAASSDRTDSLATRPTCDRFALYTSSRGNYFFADIRDLLAAGLEELGFRVDLCDERQDFDERADWHIVLAPHEFFTLGRGATLLRGELPRPLILINTEQPSTHWFALAAEIFARAHHIWDINYESAQTIRARGFPCDHLPLGYAHDVKTLGEVSALPEHYGTCFLDPDVRNRSYAGRPLSERPIDVLFLGHLTQRREQLFVRAAPVLSSYRCYLHLSDASEPILPGRNSFMNTATAVGLAQRAKIVLNVHHGQDKYFEWHRIVMLGIWQRALVVSEPSGEAPPFRAGVDFVEAELDRIPDTLAYYLSCVEGQKKGQEIAERGFETLRRDCGLADSLRSLILGLYRVPRFPEPMWRFVPREKT